MAARAQMEQVKLQEFSLRGMKSMEDLSTTYLDVPTESFMEQFHVVLKQCLFHASNKNDPLQLRPEAASILQFCSALAM